jgi:hypothetical protein
MILRNEDYNSEGPVDIYAVITRKQYRLLTTGQATLEIPDGTTMKNRKGSRSLSFSCETRELADMLEDALDVSGISWQEGL